MNKIWGTLNISREAQKQLMEAWLKLLGVPEWYSVLFLYNFQPTSFFYIPAIHGIFTTLQLFIAKLSSSLQYFSWKWAKLSPQHEPDVPCHPSSAPPTSWPGSSSPCMRRGWWSSSMSLLYICLWGWTFGYLALKLTTTKFHQNGHIFWNFWVYKEKSN